jgi:hypothetical protein
MTRTEGAQLVGMIASAYPQWKPSQETVAVYVELLHDLDAKEAQNALRSLLMANEYPPAVATIRKKVLELQDGLPLTKSEAWELVMLKVRKEGTYGSPKFEDPVVQEVVRAIGFREICQSTNTDTIRAQFFRLYDEQSTKRIDEKLSAVGFGRHNEIEGSSAKEIKA